MPLFLIYASGYHINVVPFREVNLSYGFTLSNVWYCFRRSMHKTVILLYSYLDISRESNIVVINFDTYSYE